jgi:hypothetical protein
MFRFLAGLVVLAGPSWAPAPAQAGPPVQQNPVAPKVETKNGPDGFDRMEGVSKAVREQEEARQRLWDRKVKALTGSVCTGC